MPQHHSVVPTTPPHSAHIASLAGSTHSGSKALLNNLLGWEDVEAGVRLSAQSEHEADLALSAARDAYVVRPSPSHAAP
jgi:hypothetical protein